jgi:hypothetical protein
MVIPVLRWVPLLGDAELALQIHKTCTGACSYIGLRIGVDESSELAETLRLVARPREIKVYEPVGSIDVVAGCNAW